MNNALFESYRRHLELHQKKIPRPDHERRLQAVSSLTEETRRQILELGEVSEMQLSEECRTQDEEQDFMRTVIHEIVRMRHQILQMLRDTVSGQPYRDGQIWLKQM